jgi:hypothetical protein
MESWFHQFVAFARSLGWWGALGLSLVLAAASLVLATFIVVRWPVEQFKAPEAPRFWELRHPIIRGLGLAGKNLAGLLLVLLGVVMALPGVPGQGLLMVLIGVTLLDFPGKRRLERALIRRPRILRVVNGLRRRFHRLPLDLD